MKRHENLTKRNCQNIKRARGELKPSDVKHYFENLEESLKDVLPENILNFDETNLSDDPGVEKCIFRRGVKYPERLINHSKGNISIMFCGSATGELLPPYVIYKSVHIWDSWVIGGPKGTRYGRSKNGWMNMENFEEWFKTIILAWARKHEGKKVLIGDNLSSHMSKEVLIQCQNHNISFILLPANSTDKCQPLDVAFFAPQKRAWRQILKEYKIKNPKSTSLEKSKFPSHLKKLIDSMDMKNETNLKSGFRACGIYPFNPQAVLKKFPDAAAAEEKTKSNFRISSALLHFLQQFRYDPTPEKSTGTTIEKPVKAKKKLSIKAGKSISAGEICIANEKVSKKVAKTVSTVITPHDAPSTSGTSTTRSQIDVDDPSENESEKPVSIEEFNASFEDLDFSPGDFIVCRVPCVGHKSGFKRYVAKVLSSDADGLSDVRFLRQSAKAPNKFVYPDTIDTSEINKDDVQLVLPEPLASSTATKRQASLFCFGVDLSYCE